MLTLWNGFDRAFQRDFHNIDRFFAPLATRRPSQSSFRAGWPRVNVVELEDGYELTAEVPGFAAEDLTINMENGELRIQGRVEHTNDDGGADADSDEATPAAGRVVFRERRKLEFQRTFRFGNDVDGDRIAANLKDGVLTLSLPKAASAKPKTIAVTSS